MAKYGKNRERTRRYRTQSDIRSPDISTISIFSIELNIFAFAETSLSASVRLIDRYIKWRNGNNGIAHAAQGLELSHLIPLTAVTHRGHVIGDVSICDALDTEVFGIAQQHLTIQCIGFDLADVGDISDDCPIGLLTFTDQARLG